MKPGSHATPTARGAAALALGQAAGAFPDLHPAPLDAAGLDGRDTALALAIHRAALQRWLTIDFLLNHCLSQPMHALEPSLRGVLLSAGAQILFFDRLPVHAVVDESVQLTRQMVRPAATGLVNAVLRRLAGLVRERLPQQTWAPAADRLPLTQGVLVLNEPVLPDPKQFEAHLSVATSHPAELIRHWLDQFGPQRTLALCLHDMQTPPTIVAMEAGFVLEDPGQGWPGLCAKPHAEPGFVVWDGNHEELIRFLSENPQRRVQDPGAAAAVQATADLAPQVIVDYCAGRGTKTRQLTALHPGAQVLASDPDKARRTDLRAAAAGLKNVRILEPAEVRKLPRHEADLLVLDVPCSNTAALARRPEARYRFSPATLGALVALQRDIIESAAPLLKPGGHMLYTTCSLEEQENGRQTRWIAAKLRAKVVREQLLLPASAGANPAAYHDGGYHAVVRLP